MALGLKSKFLQDYFCGDDVHFDIFSAAYRAAVRVLNNPELYPTADLDFYSELEFQLELECPAWCK